MPAPERKVTSAPAFRRVLLKLSGEALMGERDYGIDPGVTRALAKEVAGIRGEGVDKGTQPIAAGQSASLTVTLKPGTYEVFCPMSEQSHKLAGMVGKVTVTGGEKPVAPKKPPT